jgi:hypothetical protein
LNTQLNNVTVVGYEVIRPTEKNQIPVEKQEQIDYLFAKWDASLDKRLNPSRLPKKYYSALRNQAIFIDNEISNLLPY